MATQPPTINEEAGLGPNWVPLDGPPIIPGQIVAAPPASDFSPTNPKYIQGTIAPNFQHDSNFVDTGDKTAHVPKFDLMPLGPQQNAITATQVSSTVRSIVENIPPTDGILSVGLTMPPQFVVSGSPVVAPGGVLSTTWLAQTPGTVLQAPPPGLGAFQGFNSGSFDPTVGVGTWTITMTPRTTSTFAIVGSVRSAADGTYPPAGWSAVSGQQNFVTQAFSGDFPISIFDSIGPEGGGIQVMGCGSMVLFDGPAPTFVQANHGGGVSSVAFSSNNVAGDTIIVIVSAQGGGGSTPADWTISDTKGNSYSTLVNQSFVGFLNSVTTTQRVKIFAATNIASGANTVSIAGTLGSSQTFTIAEYGPLAGGTGQPIFSLLFSGEIPSINLAASGNGGVFGILPKTNLPTDVAYIDVANIFTTTQTIAATGGAVNLQINTSGGLSQFNNAANLYVRTDLFPGGLAAPFTNYACVVASSSTFPVFGIAQGAGATADPFDIYAPGSNSVKNVSIDSTGKITNYKGIATVSNGLPAEYAVSDLTAQAAAIAATTIYAVPASGQGMYRISWSADITTADAVSSTLGGTNGFQAIYTSPTDSVVKTTIPQADWTSTVNTTGTAVGGTMIVFAKASTNIQFSFDYTSNTPGQMKYELHIKVEAL